MVLQIPIQIRLEPFDIELKGIARVDYNPGRPARSEWEAEPEELEVISIDFDDDSLASNICDSSDYKDVLLIFLKVYLEELKYDAEIERADLGKTNL